MDVGNVERIGKDPIAGGGFADVWRGYHSDREVALKVIRVYGQTESGEQILRVRPFGICLMLAPMAYRLQPDLLCRSVSLAPSAAPSRYALHWCMYY